jgi:hypothetical protein
MDEFFYTCNPDQDNIEEEDCATSVNEAVAKFLYSHSPGDFVPKTVTVTAYKLHRAAGIYSPVEEYSINVKNWCAKFWSDFDLDSYN